MSRQRETAFEFTFGLGGKIFSWKFDASCPSKAMQKAANTLKILKEAVNENVCVVPYTLEVYMAEHKTIEIASLDVISSKPSKGS